MTEGSFTCPLCGLADDRLEGIYRHLLSAHRKSSLANALLNSTRSEDPAPEREDSTERGVSARVGST